MSIVVQGVSKYYGSQKTLDEVSLTIHPGKIIGLIGPNGAGKSTLMKIICGALPANTGTVKLMGTDITENTIGIRKILGYLPESNPLYPEMYIHEYLSYVAGLYKLGRKKQQRIQQVVKSTGLEPEKQKKIGALSKGYRQRVGIAQALLHDPDILVLDEPTSGLDPNQIIEIRNLIASIGKDKTVILSTHLMQEVEAICDRVIVLNNGQVVADDSPKNIQKDQKEPVQTVVLEISQKIEASVFKTLDYISKVKAIDDHNWILQAQGSEDIRPKIFDFAVEKKLTVLSMQLQHKKLEEIFQELTGKK